VRNQNYLELRPLTKDTKSSSRISKHIFSLFFLRSHAYTLMTVRRNNLSKNKTEIKDHQGPHGNIRYSITLSSASLGSREIFQAEQHLLFSKFLLYRATHFIREKTQSKSLHWKLDRIQVYMKK